MLKKKMYPVARVSWKIMLNRLSSHVTFFSIDLQSIFNLSSLQIYSENFNRFAEYKKNAQLTFSTTSTTNNLTLYQT